MKGLTSSSVFIHGVRKCQTWLMLGWIHIFWFFSLCFVFFGGGSSERFLVRLNKQGVPKSPERTERQCTLFIVSTLMFLSLVNHLMRYDWHWKASAVLTNGVRVNRTRITSELNDIYGTLYSFFHFVFISESFKMFWGLFQLIILFHFVWILHNFAPSRMAYDSPYWVHDTISLTYN